MNNTQHQMKSQVTCELHAQQQTSPSLNPPYHPCQLSPLSPYVPHCTYSEITDGTFKISSFTVNMMLTFASRRRQMNPARERGLLFLILVCRCLPFPPPPARVASSVGVLGHLGVFCPGCSSTSRVQSLLATEPQGPPYAQCGHLPLHQPQLTCALRFVSRALTTRTQMYFMPLAAS